VLDEVQVLRTMIGSLLEASRPQSIEPCPRRVEPILRECVQKLMPLARQRGFDLSLVDGPIGTLAVVDETGLSRIIGNLVQNALEAGDRGGRVTVGWRVLDPGERAKRFPGFARDVVCLSVEDDGPASRPSWASASSSPSSPRRPRARAWA